MRWCVVFLLISACGVCSSLHVNESTFASWPALYAMDDWKACRRAAGVYCIVDAKLQAAGDSPLLRQLEEYSLETRKHFNRTIIQRGMCMSQCVSESGVSEHREAARICLDRRENATGLTVSILSVRGCTPTAGSPPPPGARAFFIFCAATVAVAVAATVAHVLCERCGNTAVNPYVLSFSLKNNWAILTYDRSRPLQEPRMKDLAVLEGIRVVGMQCVMFAHVLFTYMYGFIDNPEYVEQMYDHLGWQTMLNSPIWLQAFFCMSAFITTYTTLLTAERKPHTWGKALLSILFRWVRLTPVALFALWLTMSGVPGLGGGGGGGGGQWWWMCARETEHCRHRWWWHALYLHNYLPLGRFCMGHTWYLAVDMQLHILGTISLIYLTSKSGSRWAPCLLTSAGVAAAAAVGTVVYVMDLTPVVNIQAPQLVHDLFRDGASVSWNYLPFYCNLSGYLAGMIAAFVYYTTPNIKEYKLFRIAFHLSLIFGSVAVMLGALFLQEWAAPRWARALYSALDRPATSVAAAVFMLGCVAGCDSGVRSVLSWRGFHPAGRLSYCVFLLHFLLLRALVVDAGLLHATLTQAISMFITMSVVTYIMCIPVCLMIEIPCCQLLKAIVSPPHPPAVDRSPPPAPEGLKPFDLVAHVGRRREGNGHV